HLAATWVCVVDAQGDRKRRRGDQTRIASLLGGLLVVVDRVLEPDGARELTDARAIDADRRRRALLSHQMLVRVLGHRFTSPLAGCCCRSRFEASAPTPTAPRASAAECRSAAGARRTPHRSWRRSR